MQNREVIEQVDRGYRMPKHPSTPDNVYNIMMKCWDKDAEQRPTFEYLYIFFDDYFVSSEPSYFQPDWPHALSWCH